MRCRLDGNFDDDSRDMRSLLSRMIEVHRPNVPRTSWTLDCRGCHYLGPWAAALLAAAFLNDRLCGLRPRIQLPTAPPALRAFCVFSGMSKCFRRDGPPPDAEHPDSETAPIDEFSSASWNRSDGIIRLLRRHTQLNMEREDQIRTCIQEVTQNVVDHAKSPIGGVMVARYLSIGNEVRVAIVDRGVGIAQSLRVQYPDTSNAITALRRVVEGGFSSRSRPNNLGLGVSNLFKLVAIARGRMALVTGEAIADLRDAADAPTIEQSGSDFPGTAVFFTLPVGFEGI